MTIKLFHSILFYDKRTVKSCSITTQYSSFKLFINSPDSHHCKSKNISHTLSKRVVGADIHTPAFVAVNN